MSEVDFDVKKKVEVNNKVQPPKLYKVIYLNDDATSVEFVISSLVEIFDYTHEQGEALAWKIHEDGSGVAAVLPYEIAEQKGVEVTVLARQDTSIQRLFSSFCQSCLSVVIILILKGRKFIK